MSQMIRVDVREGRQGTALCIGTVCISGPSPWLGGKTVQSFEVDADKLPYAVSVFGLKPLGDDPDRSLPHRG